MSPVPRSSFRAYLLADAFFLLLLFSGRAGKTVRSLRPDYKGDN